MDCSQLVQKRERNLVVVGCPLHLVLWLNNNNYYRNLIPEGSSLDGLLTVGLEEGEESGGGWLSAARDLLEANFFAAVADVVIP